MNIKILTALAVGVVAASALVAAPAEAAKRRSATNVDQGTRITVVDETGRARTRITVHPRSFLDPGREIIRYSQHYSDYAFPPNYRLVIVPNYDQMGGVHRHPLPGPFEPGYPGF